jgi:hypothetical protein
MLSSAKDIIKKSISLYEKKSKDLLPYVWLLLIPTALTTVISVGLAIFQDATNIPWYFNTALYVVLAIALSIFSIWVSIALIRVTAALLENRSVKTIKQEMHDAKVLIWSTIVASIFSGLAVFFGFFLFAIPAVIFGIWFAFVSQEVALEKKHGLVALKESKKLVVGRWWKVFWRLLAPGLAFAILAWIAQSIAVLPFTFLLESYEENASIFFLGSSILAILESFIAVLIVPLATAASTILYLELKKNPVKSATPASSDQK